MDADNSILEKPWSQNNSNKGDLHQNGFSEANWITSGKSHYISTILRYGLLKTPLSSEKNDGAELS